MERLDKVVAHMGKYSRSEVKDLIKKGQIVVNGSIAQSPEMKVSPETDEIRIGGENLGYTEYTYILLNKPAGVLTATEDKKQETVMDLLPKELRNRDLSPVGRLDKDTEGLLILTNDGVLAHDLLSPKKNVDKVYYARVDGVLTVKDEETLARGVTLSNGETFKGAQLKRLNDNECEITVQEGKFHEVKRLLAFCGKPVLYLKRISMGGLALDDNLEVGQFRYLEDSEVKMLKTQHIV